jgi:nucleotide-binding universal stress UspA family protein
MRAFRTLVVPVDGSATSDRGVAFALELVAADGRIAFCSVVDALAAALPVSAGVATYDPSPLLAALESDADRFCRSAAAVADKRGIANDRTTLHGTCVDEITAFASANAADAIVIGTHGRSGVSWLVLGSVAEGLLRVSTVPVVTVHLGDDVRTGPLLVAFDASPAARCALDLAIAIASAHTMRVLILAVAPSREELDDRASLASEAVRLVKLAGLDVRGVVEEGDAARAIVDAADSHECCMIVIGTHGPERTIPFLGHTASRVVEHAHVPVVASRAASLR